MRRLLISLVVLAAVLFAADYGIRLYSESVVGGEVKASLHLSRKPSVTFGGWPFVTHLVSGHLPSVSFSADSFSAHGVELRKVKLSLSDVRFPTARLVSGGGGTIRAKTGHGTAVMTAADVNGALRRAGAPFAVAISNGRASVSSGSLHVGVTVKLEGNAIVLSPSQVGSVSARFPLPTIVPGLRYTGLTLVGSDAVLTAALKHAVFVLPASG